MCKEIPLLTADDVELRTAQVKTYKAGTYITLLAYKNARVDMRVLDSVFGPTNWQRHHKLIGDRLYCTIAVWDEDKKCWVEKEDVGTESYTEKEKGQSSDSFKRAGFCWGIGRELYDVPHISFKLEESEFKGNSCYEKFRVLDMEYDRERGEFTKFIVVDKNGKVRFQKQAVTQKKEQAGTNTKVKQQNATEGKQELAEWVKDYKGKTCVHLLNQWLYFDNTLSATALKIIAVDAQGRYASIKDAAQKMLEEREKQGK